jgi:FkbM family methyltransferase
VKILIHSNAPWVPTGYGKQAALAARVLVGLGHQVSFSAFSGLQGQPITWQVPGIPGDAGVCAVYPGGMIPFGPDVLVANARVAAADVIVSLMDTYKLAPAARDLRTSGIPFVPLVISDSKAANGGPSTMDQAVIRDSGALPAAVSEFTRTCLLEVDGLYSPGWEVPLVPHAVDTSVYRPVPAKARAKARREFGTDGQFVIGIMGANKDPMRKAYAEQFEAFAVFSKAHPEARLAVFSVYDSVGGLALDEIAHDMQIIEKVMFMPTYEQVAGLLSEEYCAAWFSSLDILSACSYGEGFGVPALEAQACGTPVVATNWSAQAELAGAAGWLVEGEPYWNAAHRGWWKRPNVGRIVDAWEEAYQEKGTQAWADRQKHAVAVARRYDLKAAAVAWRILADRVESWRAAPERRIREFDGLKWKVDNLDDRFGSMLALNHESWFTDYIVGDLGPGSVFVDVGAHVGHWAVRAAARGARVLAIEADPVTCERLAENLELNELSAEIYATAAWDEVTELHLNPQNEGHFDGSNQVRPEGDGLVVKAEPLDITLGHLDRLDRLKMDVEGADLHVLRGLRATLDRLQPELFIEDHSRYGFYSRNDLNALLLSLGYDWEDLPHGYIVARPVKP